MVAGATSRMKISAVCISRDNESWNLQDFPLYDYTEGWRPYKHEQTRERVAYLAARRNEAVRGALRASPDTDHILMIDSYYLHQEDEVIRLIDEYSRLTELDYRSGCILGASTWVLDKTRIRSHLRFYDGWTTPEGNKLRLAEVEKSGGIIKVRAVGGCYVYPRRIWDRVQYKVPEDLHGCEHNWLCEHSGVPVLLSLNERLWRQPTVYPWFKRVRVSLHLGRFVGK